MLNTTAGGPDIFQILLFIVIFLALAVAMYFGIKFFARFSQRGTIFTKGIAGRKPEMGRHLHLVDRLALDKEKSIVLFDCDGKRYLVGISNQHFVLLSDTEAPPFVEDETQNQSMSFKEMFAAFKNKGNKDDQQ